MTGFKWISWAALDYFQRIWNKVKHFFPPSNLSSAYHLKLPTVTEFKYLTKRKRAFSGRAPKQSSHSNCRHRNVAPHSCTVDQRAAVSATLFPPTVCRAAASKTGLLSCGFSPHICLLTSAFCRVESFEEIILFH